MHSRVMFSCTQICERMVFYIRLFLLCRLDQTAVLKYERHRIHEFLFRNVFHIDTTDFYHSALGIKESGNQVGKGCFATAGRADKSYGSSFKCKTLSILCKASSTIMAFSLWNMMRVSVTEITGVIMI